MLWFVDFVAASLVLFIIVAVKSSSGVRAFDVATGSGFAFTAIADRGLDVAAASYEGITLAWRSRNGIASPAYYEPQATCGLTIFGPSGSDQWGSFGLHGRIDATPAEDVVHHVRWEGDECILEIRGRIRQTRVLGEDLVLERCLRTTVGGSHLEVHDTVTNEGGKQVPHMLLYHCNGGFPLLDESSELHVSQSSMRPRDAGAEKGLNEWIEADNRLRTSPARSSFMTRLRAPTAGRRSSCTTRNCARVVDWRLRIALTQLSCRHFLRGECSGTERTSWESNPRIARRSKAG